MAYRKVPLKPMRVTLRPGSKRSSSVLSIQKGFNEASSPGSSLHQKEVFSDYVGTDWANADDASDDELGDSLGDPGYFVDLDEPSGYQLAREADTKGWCSIRDNMLHAVVVNAAMPIASEMCDLQRRSCVSLLPKMWTSQLLLPIMFHSLSSDSEYYISCCR